MKGLSRLFYSVQTSLDGSSDHIPVILTVSTTVLQHETKPALYNKNTDWENFRELINKNLNCRIPMKSENDIDMAATDFTTLVQNCCWKCTPEKLNKTARHSNVPQDIKTKISEKRRLRRVWHTSRSPADKTAFNKAIKELKKAIQEANDVTTTAIVESLTATAATNYSLWKACKEATHPVIPKAPIRLHSNTWARTTQERVDAFAEHLAGIFTSSAPDNETDETDIELVIAQDLQLDLPIKPTSPRELLTAINKFENKKAPGFDLIDKTVLKELPKKALVYLTTLFNGILRIGYFPAIWKVSQIIMIPKPGKPPNEITSYRPISLLPILSKLLEKILLKRLLHALHDRSIIPDHQFGFRQEHATTEQIHRVCHKIRTSLEKKEYCSAVFLDIQQAFDKVWHKGLLYKIKSCLPHTFFNVLQSYLSERIFQVRENDTTSAFYDIKAGVPQGSVLGPVLYTLFTADLPHTPEVTIATYADDTAILASSDDPDEASLELQNSLDNIHTWLKKWRVKASATKSAHITFTLRREDCPPVNLGGCPLPHNNSVKYLGMHLDRRLTWRKHIETKRNELNIKSRKLHWMLGRNSRLSLDNKLLIYKTILKPVWTYGIQLWGSACDSNIKIIQRAEDAILKQLANSPWFIKNQEVHDNLHIATVKEEIKSYTMHYNERLLCHPNQLAVDLTAPGALRRLKRRNILDR